MTEREKHQLLKKCGALRPVHHRLTSGRHCGEHLEPARLFEDADMTALYVGDILSAFSGQGFDAVVGPALGGVIPAYEAARQLGARCLFTERINGRMRFARGFTLAPGDKVLIMEDVITTGGSVREVVALVEERGAKVTGIGSVVDRSGGKALFDVKLSVAVTLEVDTYEPEECPLCAAGKPLEQPAAGRARKSR